ncbi:hypothetical protein DEO72_LG6g803 [Vigna unguiculata]|uniref:Uncharacterized protein n=1 Tax=Vigna unguiculata TaxID=3917 RepID=A0A4D6M6R0_VIGUN|nr:hypothetical protein DEO72_LG6g803 [Vigna unguiculata]
MEVLGIPGNYRNRLTAPWLPPGTIPGNWDLCVLCAIKEHLDRVRRRREWFRQAIAAQGAAGTCAPSGEGLSARQCLQG